MLGEPRTSQRLSTQLRTEARRPRGAQLAAFHLRNVLVRAPGSERASRRRAATDASCSTRRTWYNEARPAPGARAVGGKGLEQTHSDTAGTGTMDL